eukprot:5489068-Amphidinium_carterae.1
MHAWSHALVVGWRMCAWTVSYATCNAIFSVLAAKATNASSSWAPAWNEVHEDNVVMPAYLQPINGNQAAKNKTGAQVYDARHRSLEFGPLAQAIVRGRVPWEDRRA